MRSSFVHCSRPRFRSALPDRQICLLTFWLGRRSCRTAAVVCRPACNYGADGAAILNQVPTQPEESTASAGALQPTAGPLVSVCISAYNVEPYLEKALASVLRQTHLSLEIIVVDNGSDDRTFEIMSSVRDDRFRCFRLPENIGGYQAMNLVAGMANGEYVAIYHSDDVYEPTIVEREVGYLEARPDVGAVFTMCRLIDESDAVIGQLGLPRELAGLERISYDDVFPVMLERGNVMFPCPSFMIRRSVLGDIGPFDADRWDIAADVEMWLRLTRAHPVGVLDEPLFRYRHTSQQWTRRWKRRRTAPNRALDAMELYLVEDRWQERMPHIALELEALRRDDETTRAVNALDQNDADETRRLLRGRYPYRALIHNVRRRKVRVVVLRGLMKSLLAAGAEDTLARILRRTERGEWQ
jgi:GT2 family glycosyltransferase